MRRERVVFLQEHHADEAIEILRADSSSALLDYLMQWHQPGNHETVDGPAPRSSCHFERDGYVVSWDDGLPWVALDFEFEE